MKARGMLEGKLPQHDREQAIVAAERALIEAADKWEEFRHCPCSDCKELHERIREWREAKGDGT